MGRATSRTLESTMTDGDFRAPDRIRHHAHGACVALRRQGCAVPPACAIGEPDAGGLGIGVASREDAMTLRNLVAAGLYLLPAVLFTEIARQQWIFRRFRRPKGRLFQLMPIVTTVLAIHYGALVARALVPGALSPNPMHEILTPWHAEIEVSWLVSLVLVRHLLRLTPLPEDPPSTAWLVGNYGLGIGGAAALLALRLWPGATETQQVIAHRVFEVTFGVLGMLCFVQIARIARPGKWGPENAGELRGPDVRLVRIGV